MNALYRRVYDVVARIPRGRVVTYGQIARHLGLWNGARLVGWAMHECPEGLPWQRVVNARGEISRRGKAWDCVLQRALLEEEGVVFDAAGRIDLHVFGWDEI